MRLEQGRQGFLLDQVDGIPAKVKAIAAARRSDTMKKEGTAAVGRFDTIAVFSADNANQATAALAECARAGITKSGAIRVVNLNARRP
jgi:hypothetical protein